MLDDRRAGLLGVAMLTRTVFIESVERYNGLFKVNPPSRVAQFVERVPMVEGRLERKASTAIAYAWLIWEKGRLGSCELVWIPPERKKLERDKDYDLPPSKRNVRQRSGFDQARQKSLKRVGLGSVLSLFTRTDQKFLSFATSLQSRRAHTV